MLIRWLSVGVVSIFVSHTVLGAEDPCRGAFEIPAEEISACRTDGTCSQVDRAYVMCEMRGRLVKQYSLLREKDRLLSKPGNPFSSMAHLNGCVEREKKLEGNQDSLDFEDRIRECLAGFQDSHLNFESPDPAPLVFLGFVLKEINGKFYVASRLTPTIRYLRDVHKLEDIDNEIAVGTEVTQIDGVKVSEARDRLLKFIGASTEAAGKLEATRDLTERNFFYPKSGSVQLKIRLETNAEGKNKVAERSLRLPWWSYASRRRDITHALKMRGIILSDLIRWKYQPAEGNWVYEAVNSDGYDPASPILPEVDRNRLEVYNLVNESGNEAGVAFRFGTVALPKARAMGYLQVLSFLEDRVKKPGTETKPVDFIEPLIGFINECKQKNLDIVLDLRENSGGHVKLPPKLISLLLRKDEEIPGAALAFRITPDSERVLRPQAANSDDPSRYLDHRNIEVLYDMAPLVYDSFERSARAKESHTEIFFGKTIKANDKIDGFEGKVVVLTSANCVSACDITAALLKTSKRGILVGTPTNGTGAGYSSLNPWTDVNNVMKLSIPNFLFGVSETDLGTVSIAFEENKARVLLENRPTPPDVPYETTLEELKGKAQGWLDISIQQIFGAI